MKYMLDTNTCIYAIKNKTDQIIDKMRERISEGICISSISFAELEHEMERSLYPDKNQLMLLKFLVPIEIVPFDSKAAMKYGKIKADLEKEGNTIGTMDMMISAHALSEDMAIVTSNVEEFERVPGLKVENWV